MSKITVKEVLQLAIETDMIQLAHRVFWAVATGRIQVDEDSKRLVAIDYDEAEISAMITQNTLALGKVKLYVVETRTQSVFAFYYSENVLAANALHQEMFREKPKRVTNADHLLPKLFYFNEMNSEEILYFNRNQVAAYPCYVGHARAGERSLYYLFENMNFFHSFFDVS